jgi:hypothetical protein
LIKEGGTMSFPAFKPDVTLVQRHDGFDDGHTPELTYQIFDTLLLKAYALKSDERL